MDQRSVKTRYGVLCDAWCFTWLSLIEQDHTYGVDYFTSCTLAALRGSSFFVFTCSVVLEAQQSAASVPLRVHVDHRAVGFWV